MQHRRIYRISPDTIKRVFTSGALWSCIEGIPPDATILEIYQEHVEEDVFIVCIHPDLDKIPRGAVAPQYLMSGIVSIGTESVS